jgi:hypothetical protein
VVVVSVVEVSPVDSVASVVDEVVVVESVVVSVVESVVVSVVESVVVSVVELVSVVVVGEVVVAVVASVSVPESSPEQAASASESAERANSERMFIRYLMVE